MKGTGSLKKVRPGVWRGVMDLPRGEDGKRKQKRVTIEATGEVDAQRQWNRILSDGAAGKVAAPSKTILESYLSHWLDYREAHRLSPKTIETWRFLAATYINPRLGAKRLEKVTVRDIRDLHTHLLTKGRKDGSGLAPRSVVHIHRLLSEVLKAAHREGLIPQNPCELVSAPKVEKKEREFADEDQVARFVAAAGDGWLRLPILLAAGAGLCRSEVMGLRWSAITLDPEKRTGTLAVRQGALKLKRQAVVFAKPKTENRRRTITLPAFLVDELLRQKGWQAQQKLTLGDAWQEHGLVVCNQDGTPRSPMWLTNDFAKLADRVGLPAITFHDLRHSAATIQLAEGVPLKVVSKRLGHSTIAVTADIYSHVLQRSDEDAADKTDAVFRRALGS
jgi:integrase